MLLFTLHEPRTVKMKKDFVRMNKVNMGISPHLETISGRYSILLGFKVIFFLFDEEGRFVDQEFVKVGYFPHG